MANWPIRVRRYTRIRFGRLEVVRKHRRRWPRRRWQRIPQP